MKLTIVNCFPSIPNEMTSIAFFNFLFVYCPHSPHPSTHPPLFHSHSLYLLRPAPIIDYDLNISATIFSPPAPSSSSFLCDSNFTMSLIRVSIPFVWLYGIRVTTSSFVRQVIVANPKQEVERQCRTITNNKMKKVNRMLTIQWWWSLTDCLIAIPSSIPIGSFQSSDSVRLWDSMNNIIATSVIESEE